MELNFFKCENNTDKIIYIFIRIKCLFAIENGEKRYVHIITTYIHFNFDRETLFLICHIITQFY